MRLRRDGGPTRYHRVGPGRLCRLRCSAGTRGGDERGERGGGGRSRSSRGCGATEREPGPGRRRHPAAGADHPAVPRRSSAGIDERHRSRLPHPPFERVPPPAHPAGGGLRPLRSGRGAVGLGPSSYELASSFVLPDSLARQSQGVVARLTVETGALMAAVAVLDGTDVMMLSASRRTGDGFVAVGVAPTIRYPAHLTATGRALLAQRSRGELRALYGNRAVGPTDRTRSGDGRGAAGDAARGRGAGVRGVSR